MAMLISKSLSLLLVVILLMGLLPLAAGAQPGAEIEQALLDKLIADETGNFFVKMTLEADTNAAAGMELQARRAHVWKALNEAANAAQGPVIDYCQKNGLDCTPMVINNSVFVRDGSLDAARGLAALPGVAYLRLERTYLHPDLSVDGPGLEGIVTADASPDTITNWGITDTGADQVWRDFRVRGAGIKVASIDTGVQWNHPALVDQFACPGEPSNADCWSDPSNICAGSACDNTGYGTQTMGVMVAKNDQALPYIAGMAPDATWIACKGCESSSCSESALTACAGWILAPGGDTANAPDVVVNSWGGGEGDDWFLTYVNNWRSAGIFPIFISGNGGPSCSSLISPADYQESFASAAHDSSRNIATFSSRGPSAFGHDPYTKPNVSAPGVNVCSTWPGDLWLCGSGASLASAHAAGAVALAWSACPDLRGEIGDTFELIAKTADTPPAGNCGAPPDGGGNYTYGYGFLDASGMVSDCFDTVDLGTLQGHVYDQAFNPVAGATVIAIRSKTLADGNAAASPSDVNITTGPSGFYTMRLAPGAYEITASKDGYSSPETGVVVQSNLTTVQDLVLSFLGVWTQIALPPGCPDWNRFDAEYDPGTGKAYLLGGRSSVSTYGDIYSFDPVTQTCADTGVDMPVPVSNYTIAPVNNGSDDLLCIFGGRQSDGSNTAVVQCYDPVANQASLPSNLPGSLGEFIPGGVAVVNNQAYVFGGFRSGVAPYLTDQTWAWDPVGNTWTQKGNLGLARGYIDMAVADGKIYAFGGDTYNGSDLIAQTLSEVFNPAIGTWNNAAVADLPTASDEGRAYGFDTASAYELAGKIVIAGGGQWPIEWNEVVVYDIATDTYDYSFRNLNIRRFNHAGFFVPGHPGVMWVLGGQSLAPGYGGTAPPYAPPEYCEVPQSWREFLPLLLKN
jgi:hypothetical protein